MNKSKRNTDPKDKLPCETCGHKGQFHIRVKKSEVNGEYYAVRGSGRYGACDSCKCKEFKPQGVLS